MKTNINFRDQAWKRPQMFSQRSQFTKIKFFNKFLEIVFVLCTVACFVAFYVNEFFVYNV